MALVIVYLPSSLKEIQAFPHKQRAQIIRKIERLAENPKAASVKRLHGELRDYLRARSGDYRIWFYVAEDTLHVVKVMDRQDGYD